MKRPFLFIVAIAAMMSACKPADDHPQRVDRFVGNLVLVDFEGSNFRDFKLGEDLKYIDPRGVEWIAWAGMVTDGASIPQFLWSIVGSPYTGNYRRAAIMHDFYYSHLYRKWEDVQNMFYDAMITDGVSKSKALLMYYVVYRFSHKWDFSEIRTCPPNFSCAKPGDLNIRVAIPIINLSMEKVYLNEVASIKQVIDEGNLNRQDIERIAHDKASLDYGYVAEIVSDDWFDFGQRNKIQ